MKIDLNALHICVFDETFRFLQDSTCLMYSVILDCYKYCIFGSVVAHRRTGRMDASSRLGRNKGRFALHKNRLGCMCTYIYNRCVNKFFL